MAVRLRSLDLWLGDGWSSVCERPTDLPIKNYAQITVRAEDNGVDVNTFEFRYQFGPSESDALKYRISPEPLLSGHFNCSDIHLNDHLLSWYVHLDDQEKDQLVTTARALLGQEKSDEQVVCDYFILHVALTLFSFMLIRDERLAEQNLYPFAPFQLTLPFDQTDDIDLIKGISQSSSFWVQPFALLYANIPTKSIGKQLVTALYEFLNLFSSYLPLGQNADIGSAAYEAILGFISYTTEIDKTLDDRLYSFQNNFRSDLKQLDEQVVQTYQSFKEKENGADNGLMIELQKKLDLTRNELAELQTKILNEAGIDFERVKRALKHRIKSAKDDIAGSLQGALKEGKSSMNEIIATFKNYQQELEAELQDVMTKCETQHHQIQQAVAVAQNHLQELLNSGSNLVETEVGKLNHKIHRANKRLAELQKRIENQDLDYGLEQITQKQAEVLEAIECGLEATRQLHQAGEDLIHNKIHEELENLETKARALEREATRHLHKAGKDLIHQKIHQELENLEAKARELELEARNGRASEPGCDDEFKHEVWHYVKGKVCKEVRKCCCCIKKDICNCVKREVCSAKKCIKQMRNEALCDIDGATEKSLAEIQAATDRSLAQLYTIDPTRVQQPSIAVPVFAVPSLAVRAGPQALSESAKIQELEAEITRLKTCLDRVCDILRIRC